MKHRLLSHSPPESSVLGLPLQLFPCQPALLDACLKIHAPGVLGTITLSCFLGVPFKGLPDDAGLCVQECVADPSPSSSLPFPQVVGPFSARDHCCCLYLASGCLRSASGIIAFFVVLHFSYPKYSMSFHAKPN